MCKVFLIQLIILSCVSVTIFAYDKEPRIITRNGHLSLSVDKDKDINFLVSGEGRIKVNDKDIIGIVNSLKNVSNLIETLSKLSRNPGSSNDNPANGFTPMNQNFTQSIDRLEQSFKNHTYVVKMQITRMRRRLNMMQRNYWQTIATLSNDECSSNPCSNGGTCQDLYNKFLCVCPTSWEGATCEKDVNECAVFAGTDLGCQNGATCVNKVGSYECVCAAGFHGVHCTTKSIDCYAAGKDLCGHGTCIPQASGYKCFCDQGWTTDGKNPACNVDVNECESHTFSCSKNPMVPCINVPGSFYCGHCPAGYSGNGYYCNDIDECQIFNGGCSMNPQVQCINTPGSRACGLCPPGYVGNGVVCTYQGSVCAVNNGGCHLAAQCRDNPRISSSYVECICPRGYSGNGIGPDGCVRSSTGSNPCSPDPCVFGTCSVNNHTGDYVCSCNRKYTGRNCDIKKDPCLSNPCKNGGTCMEIFGVSYRCRCLPQYTGPSCQNEKQACGGKLEGFDGTLRFPFDPNQEYNHALSCAWVIQTNSSKVLNITFTKFDLEDSVECQYDWVQIHDGRNSAAYNIGRFCGSKLPKGGNIVTTTNLVYIWFRSDTRLAKAGFALNWTTIDPVCGGEISATSYGTIQTPGYPGNYPLNRDCYWKLVADNTKRIEFQFFTLMIGQDANCTGDYLEFYYDTVKSDNRFAQYCTTTHPAPLTSPSHKVTVYFHSDDKLSYSGFQISYKVISGIPSCGGTFTTATGQIASPAMDFSPFQFLSLDCEYKISVANQLRIKVQFRSLKLYKYGGHCNEHVRLFDGPTVNSPLIGKYCGDTIPPPFLSTGNEVLVKYFGRHQDGFSLRYETICGMHLTAPTGVIMSPDYPAISETSMECIYEIRQSPGTAITLTLVDFFRRNLLFRQPTTIAIEVRDGGSKESPSLKRYNMLSTLPDTVSSRHNYLTIFVIASPFQGMRYYMNYTTFEVGCGGILVKDLGMISSPNHPGSYPNQASCKWVIQAPPRHVVQLTFLSFKLETSHSCGYDYVKVYDVNGENEENEGIIGKFCGGRLPPVLLSSSNSMGVIFRTDTSHTSDGFLASYIFVPEENICGGSYFTNAGVIKSPKYPKHYPVNRDCKWVVHVEPGRQIMLNITDFEVESYANCRYDFLEIRNGGTSASPLIGKFCGTTIPKTITSHANQLFLHFKTDMTRNAKGFYLTWSSASTGCGGLLTSPTGSVISPHYPEPYNKNAECFWKISINAGSIIQIVFADLDLEPHITCYLDYVEIYDGKDLSGKSLGRYCSSHPPFLRSTSNHMMIKFRADVSFQGRGFQIQYSTVCDNTLTGYSGIIESPNFPNPYPQNKECTWTVGVPEGNKINITFSHFELERSMSFNAEKCNFDYLEFIYTDRDTDESVKKTFCGEQIPPMLTINSNTTKIRFVSDHLLMGNGFRLEWQIVGCGGIFTRPEGEFFSPNYPNHYPASTRCDWIIEATYDYSIAVTFDKLDIEPSTACSFDVVQIYNGPNDKAHLMNELCHTTKPVTITSSGNSMLVRFQSDPTYEGTGFKGTYKFVPSKCGGMLSASRGEFTSPNYPKNYDAGSKCHWVIEVEQHRAIVLTFHDVDLALMANENYIKVFDGPNEAYPLLATLIGDKTPNETYRSTYNHMTVVLETSSQPTTAKGFKASYEMACGAILDSEPSGIIDYVPDESLYSDACEMTISSPDLSKKISLSIHRLRGYYCEFNIHYINIYNGFNSSAPIIGSYCTSLPPMITSTGSMLHISANMGFKATYTTVSNACGGSLEGERGAFVTPNYPNNYPVDIECEWIVNISDSIRTVLTFSSFNLVDSEHCNDDFLEIREDDKSGKLLGIYCGDNAPVNVSAVGNIWIYFKSSKPDVGETAVTAKGFEAEYYLDKHTDLYGPSGSIHSPSYPNLYTRSEHFSWRITVKFGYKIAIYVKEMNMMYGNDEFCYSASITFYDGYDMDAPVLHQICTVTIKSFTSTSNVMFIEANIDLMRLGIKFYFDWLQVEHVENATAVEKTKCGGNGVININALRNYTLTSPGYPHGYENDLDCEWIFSTIPENHLQIDFLEVDLENLLFGNCLTDRVEVYTGVDGVEDWKLLDKICMPNDRYRDTIKASNLMKVVFKTDNYKNRTGFAATVVEGCGGSVQKTNGIIEVTKATFSNFFSLNCQWNVSVRTGRVMKIEFEMFDVGTNTDSKCDNYILLRNGQTATSPLLGAGKYCDGAPPSLETISNHLFIKFSTKSKVQGFKMKYEEVSVDCDGRFTLTDLKDTKNISSPNFPNIPLPHTECAWLISTLPGEAIQVDFVDRFDLTDSPNCTKEYVEVRDGGTIMSPLIGRYCESMPGTLTTRDNMVFIKFFTDVEDPRNGFKAKISVAKCGGTIRDMTGEIKSRYFGNRKGYPQNEKCSWEIVVPDGHSISFTFEKIELPGSGSGKCDANYVEILEHGVFDYSNLTRIVKVCKEHTGAIRSASNKALVRFVSGDNPRQAAGFWLKFESSKEKCGGKVDGDFGYITSPRYPVMYPTKCEWTIKVAKGRRIQVEILDLDFDTSQPSQGLAFSNSESFAGYITLVKAGDNVRYVLSTDNTMSIFFWAVFPSNHRGFKLRYTSNEETICLGDFSLPSGSITSPANNSYYYCTWNRIETATTPRTLALTLTSNAREKTGSSPSECASSRSYLIVTAGSDDMELGQICPSYGKQKTIRNPYLKTDLIANLMKSNFTFIVDYKTYNCGGIINEQTGNITSPGFPKRTSDTIECAWLIELHKEQTVKLKFDNLDLGDDCTKSFVIIYNGKLNTSPRLGKYCRNTNPQTLHSQSNHLWVEYHSETSAGKGFNLTYEAISTGCGGVFHDTTRIIQSPNYPDDYPNNAECVWEVRAEEGYHIGLQFFDRFHIEKSEGCVNDYVEVLDYRNDNWSTLGRVCGREVFKPMNSSSTQMKIVFRSNDKATGTGFKAKWSLNCGGNFTATATTQYISSPGYPNNYADDLNCWYNITAPSKYIQLKFEQFALERGPGDCRYDNVTISYRLYGIQRTQTYCGDNKPPVVNVKDLIAVRFKTDTFIRKSGFVFSFATDDCGGDIYTPREITSPAFLSDYARRQKCVWKVLAPKGKVVAVKFDKIETRDSRSCWYNYVSLYDGYNTTTDFRLAKLCGNGSNHVPIIKSTNNQMAIEYQSLDGNSHLFRAYVYFTYGPNVGCGGIVSLGTANSKNIETPNLEGAVDCQWIVQAPDDYYLNIEVVNRPPCREDKLNMTNKLEIRNGGSHFSELIIDLCDNIETTKTFSTSNPFAFIQWSTADNRNGRDKFKLKFSTAKSKCGVTTLMATERAQYLTSPNFPDPYPANIQCVWKINATTVYKPLSLKVVSFDLGQNDDPNEECVGDRLEIVDKDNRRVIEEGLGSETVYYFGRRGPIHRSSRVPLGVHRYCGATATEFHYYSGQGDVVVTFNSGGVKHGKGFKLEYATVGVCRNYTTVQGRLYSNNVTNCDTFITTPANTTISLYFVHFGMYSLDTNCSSSRMEIYDGDSPNNKLLGKFCDYAVPDPVFSTANKLLIRLRRHPSYTFGYYDIIFTSTTEGRGCGGKIYNYKGAFTSPLYPNNFRNISHCTWDVTVPFDLRVSLKFTVFDIKAACHTDYVTVTTYLDDRPNEQKYCQSDNIPIFESINRITVEYVTSFNNGGSGWVAQFRAFSEDQTIQW